MDIRRRTAGSTMLAAERRRRIYDWALQNGSVNVSALAAELGVGENTIRRDLDRLHGEGKLLRSHGGAVLRDPSAVRQPYSEVRHANIAQKEWIGEAALALLPDTGSIFFGPGSTVFRMVSRIPKGQGIHVVTNSPEVALQLVSTATIAVDLLGGRLRQDSYGTDCSLSEHALEMLYWDVTFMGVSAIDVDRGITSIDLSGAEFERKIIEHGSKVVVLCDSSKLERFSYARVGPVDMIDVLVTDVGASPDTVDALRDNGVEVIVAGPLEVAQ